MTQKDPYDILGVSRSATQEEIKRAYRRLAKEYHPDRNPGNDQAAQKFKEVHAAYEVLGDPQRREQFDRFGAGGPAPDVHTWTTSSGSPFEDIRVDFGSMGDLTSIFEQFFSRGATRGRRRTAGFRARPPQPSVRGANLEHTVDLGFDEALRGATRQVTLQQPGGASETIEFRVPPGVVDGQRIRVRGKGHPGPAGRGDLMIRCRVHPHPYFRRDGNNLLLDLPLSITEAALGTQVEVPTLDGRSVLTVPPGTASGTKLRLRGRGVPDPRGGESGDMLAIVKIVPPREMSSRARELLEELQQETKTAPRASLPWAK